MRAQSVKGKGATEFEVRRSPISEFVNLSEDRGANYKWSRMGFNIKMEWSAVVAISGQYNSLVRRPLLEHPNYCQLHIQRK